MSAALLGTVLTASLAGSLHCAGMCGGFVAFYSGDSADGTRGAERWVSHAAYNGGRLLTYTLLGAFAGTLGAALDRAGAVAGVQRVAAIAAGVLIVSWGAYALLQALDVRLPRLPFPRAITRATSRVFGGLRGRPPVIRALLLGLLSTVLPCGWLWGFAVFAAGTGDPWQGALVMAAFWAGTVPVMLGIGISVQALSARLRRRLPAVTAATLIVVGLLWLAGRVAMPHPRPADNVSVEDASSLTPGESCPLHSKP
jgi:sulfite exporter TauE/SafE